MSKARSTGNISNIIKTSTTCVTVTDGTTDLLIMSGSGRVTIPGDLVVLGGIAGSSAESASYSLSSSFATNANLLDGIDGASFLQTGSFNAFSSSIDTTIKNKLNNDGVISGSVQVDITSTTGYSTFSSSLSSSIGSLSGSVATTTSGLAGRITTVEGNYATTGSNTFIGDQTITGSICSNGNIVTTGQIVAQTINVQQVTSSIVYSCGSNTFGCSLTNNQVFTGSVFITGSNINANVDNVCFQGSVCAQKLRISSTGDLSYIYNSGASTTDANFYIYNSTSDILMIRNSGCVGLNIANPQARLDIAGNNNALGCTNTLRFTDTDTATELNQQIGKIEFYSSDTSTPGAGVKAYMGAFASDSTPDAYLSFATQDGSLTPDPVERLRITSEGNLQVGYSGAPNIAGKLFISRGDQYGLTINAFSGGNCIISTDDNMYFTFGTTPALRMICNLVSCFAGTVCAPSFQSSGNTCFGGMTLVNSCLGIGTTTPSTKLNIRSDATDDGILLEKSDGTDIARLFYDGTSTNARLDMFCGGSTKVQIHTNGTSHFSGGNVGIGVTSPSQILHLQTALACSSGVGTALQITSDGAGGDQAWIGVNKGTGNGLEFSVENRDIIFNTCATTPFGGCERMRIASGGDVYIRNTTAAGTNSQNLPGAFYFEGYGWNTSAGSENIQGRMNLCGVYDSSSGSVEPALVFSLKGSGGGNVVPAGPNTLTERMRITNAGYIGIGISSPSYKLEVCGPGETINIIGASSGDIATGFRIGRGASLGAQIYDNPQDNITTINAAGGLNLRAGGSGRLSISSTGIACFSCTVCAPIGIFSTCVGIGTTEPQDKLEIKSGYLRMFDPSSGSNAGYLIQWSSNNGGTNVTYAGIDAITTSAGNRTGDLRFLTSNAGGPTERVRITSTGNIIPSTNGTQDLGSSSLRWCTVYTSDLSLNNGIGNYTIVEGENDLFIYNNNSCKVYKFLLQEVCPEMAPAKRSI